jgi:hypothetical protein
MSDITHLVDEPTVVESDGSVEVDRWQKYGHDRLYLDVGTGHAIPRAADSYINLQEGEVVVDMPDHISRSPDVRLDVDSDGVATVTKHWGDDNSKAILVIDLFGNGREVAAPEVGA